MAMTLARRGRQVAIRRPHHVSWQGDEGGDDDAEQVNGFGPLGSHGVECLLRTCKQKSQSELHVIFLTTTEEVLMVLHLCVCRNSYLMIATIPHLLKAEPREGTVTVSKALTSRSTSIS
jgi:hypothetical protein